jgi:hypothetical protein
MGKEAVGLIAIVLILQFAISVLHPSLHSVSKCALSMLALLSAFSVILTAINEYEPPTLDYGQMDDDRYYDTLAESYENGIAMEVAEQYKVDVDKIYVSISGLDLKKMRAEQIYVRIDDLRADYRGIREFVARYFLLDGGDIEVELVK